MMEEVDVPEAKCYENKNSLWSNDLKVNKNTQEIFPTISNGGSTVESQNTFSVNGYPIIILNCQKYPKDIILDSIHQHSIKTFNNTSILNTNTVQFPNYDVNSLFAMQKYSEPMNVSLSDPVTTSPVIETMERLSVTEMTQTPIKIDTMNNGLGKIPFISMNESKKKEMKFSEDFDLSNSRTSHGKQEVTHPNAKTENEMPVTKIYNLSSHNLCFTAENSPSNSPMVSGTKEGKNMKIQKSAGVTNSVSRTIFALDQLKKNLAMEKDFQKLNLCIESLRALKKILINERNKQQLFIDGKCNSLKESSSIVWTNERPLTPAQKLLKKFSLLKTVSVPPENNFVDKKLYSPQGCAENKDCDVATTAKRKRLTERDQLVDNYLNESWVKGKSASNGSEVQNLSFREERALNYAIAQFAELEKNGLAKQREGLNEGKQLSTLQMKKQQTVKRKIAGKIRRKNLSRKFLSKKGQRSKQMIVKERFSVNKELRLSRSTGETLLHKAARLGNPDLTEKSIQNGGNIHASDHAGWTPLHEACSRCKIDVIRMLLKYGADPNTVSHLGVCPLHNAVCKGDFQSIRLLLSFGADVEISSYTGVLPADLARRTAVKTFLQDVLKEKHILEIGGIKDQLTWKFSSSCDQLDKNDCAGIFDELPNNEPITFHFATSKEEFPISYYLPYSDCEGQIVGYRNYFILSEILKRFGISKKKLLETRNVEIMTLTRLEIERFSQQNILTNDLSHMKHLRERIQLVHIPLQTISSYIHGKLYQV